MPTGTVHFKELIRDYPECGSEDKHMVSCVFFDLQGGDEKRPEAHPDLEQAAGAKAPGPIEVSPPAGYSSPFDQQKFQAEVEQFFRGRVGS